MSKTAHSSYMYHSMRFIVLTCCEWNSTFERHVSLYALYCINVLWVKQHIWATCITLCALLYYRVVSETAHSSFTYHSMRFIVLSCCKWNSTFELHVSLYALYCIIVLWMKQHIELHVSLYVLYCIIVLWVKQHIWATCITPCALLY